MNQAISTDEMCRRYEEAGDKDACIRSLARLNDCTEGQIRVILEQGGAFARADRQARPKRLSLPSPRKEDGAFSDVLAAAKRVSALDYARASGHRVHRTVSGWRSSEISGLSFATDGSWRLGRYSGGGALSFITRFEGLDAEQALMKLLETCNPSMARYVETRRQPDTGENHARMHPRERLKGVKENERTARPDEKRRGKEEKDYEREI